jgi:hypothetical protein
MSDTRSKSIFICVPFLLFAVSLKAQFSKSDSLQVGKRGNVIWDRKISVFNLGNEQWNYYYKIFYRSGTDAHWHKTGPLGRKLKPYFENNEAAKQQFNLYRRQKKRSFLMLGAAGASLGAWTTYTAYELNRTNDLKTYVKPLPLLLLTSYFVTFYFGRKTNIKGDIHLLRAVRSVNQTIEAETTNGTK